MNTRRVIVSLAILASLSLVAWSVLAHEGEHHSPGGNGQPGDAPLAAQGFTPCVGGMAGTFPCNKVDLASLLPIPDIDGTNAAGVTANDIWGWTDATTNKEYALLGLSNGVAFVDVTSPAAPVYLGNLPRTAGSADSLWRSLKVYRNHLYAVSEAAGHGLQVFDLTRLRGVTTPQTFTETAHYDNFSSAHTINVDEETGFLYVAGSKPTAGRTPNVDTCPGATATRGGGLHVVDARNPGAPAFAGCVNEDGYTHETQCLVYRGPDVQHQGREVCLSSNEDTLTIVDVTNKSAPQQLSRTTYAGVGYTHQGWLTGDQRSFLINDELDEQQQHLAKNRTIVFDVSDLDAPLVRGTFQGSTQSIDHNLYVRGLFAFESNYRSGVRVLDVRDAIGANLSEVAFFDVYPVDDQALFNGTWSNYPFFASGTIIASGIEQGLFVLRPQVNLPVRIDYEPFFVRQQYKDFLGREPDEPGMAFWTHEIDQCMGDAACREVRKINVSAAFFQSIEFQNTGYLVERVYKTAFGDAAGTFVNAAGNVQPIPVPVIRRGEFLADGAIIRNGIIVGQGAWQAQLETNKNAYALAFVQRQRFTDAFPLSMTPAAFVDKLDANAGGVLDAAERTNLVDELTANNTNAGRASVLRKVAEDSDLDRREKSRAFVLMQYFGYLQRNPDDAPQLGLNHSGWKFWLDKLEQFNGNFVQAEMVKAFLASDEYRQRFAQ
ncbi:MAG TPA: choice-of-anchor B family protein [Pyrinomonadaceae bacterium]|nr:choice-of-anchor B family protein [Pyrinomonadaceae bacterium]